MPLGFDDEENECPVCGGIIWGRGQKVLIEGATMNVCSSCAQHGKKIRYKETKMSARQGISNVKNPVQKKAVKNRNYALTDSQEIVDDYAKKIRNARMARNLNQDQFAQKLNEKPSLIRRIETGKVKPTVKPDQKSVFLDIFVENSAVTQPQFERTRVSSTAPSSFNYTIETSRSQNRVVLKSGQTTLIGGLITKMTEHNKTGIPILQEIPVIGWFFKGKRRMLVDKQILIFITPTLV